jgi:protein-tyrosine-phosphatase
MRLMFLDYDNTLYSQMAQGLAKKFNKNEELEILSSGLNQGKELNKEMLVVIDISARKPDGLALWMNGIKA